MIFTIVALLYLGTVLVMKTRVHHSIVTNLWFQRLIAASSAFFMLGGTLALLFVIIKSMTLFVADIALASFFFGMANIGWIAENFDDTFDSAGE